MNFRPFLFLSAISLVLTGCQTLNGVQKDFNALTASMGKKISSVRAQEIIPHDGTCPPITIDPQLDHLSEFTDMENPSAEQEISRIALTRTQNECAIEGDILNMRIDLAFTSILGPKARRHKKDRPFFAYPYFIAVTDGQGNELAREVFAASVSYDTKQSEISIIETIRQKLPLNEDGTLPAYRVQIGFQLTQDQLFYNASL